MPDIPGDEDIRMADVNSSASNAQPAAATNHVASDPAGANNVMTEEELEKKFPDRPRNFGETLTFHDLCFNLFKKLVENQKKKMGPSHRGKRELRPHEVRRNIIDQFISRWRNEVGNDIFPAFRLVMCDKDRDRSVYHLKEQKIGKLLVKIMMINKDSEDGYALLHWKQPGVGSKNLGEFPTRCYEIIKKRPIRTTPSDYTIAQVNKVLDELAQTNAEDKQLLIFKDLYFNMCAEELQWLIRIILREMKVGATEKTFFDAWHPDAHALFNVSSSLRRVCWELWDPNFRLEEDTKGVLLMSCFQPQLAQFQKRSLTDVVKAMGAGNEFWIEEKLDGERIQMHYDKGSFRWWSRKAKEYTYLYGDSFETGAMGQFIKKCFIDEVQSVILDGEMITWDPKLDCIVAFGTLKAAAIETSNNPFTDGHKPLFRVFDILYLNGRSLIDYTLEDRRRALKKVIKPEARRLEICEHKVATSANEIESELRTVVATSSEGLVIKSPRSQYRLNDRNDDWVKVKPEYMTEFGESLDCLAIGGYWGSGSRAGILGSYLCGLRVDGNDLLPGDSPCKFWSFCKVGGGFTANDYAIIKHRVDDCKREWDKEPPPKGYIELAGGHRQFEKPDVWFPIENTFVVEIKAASVASSDQFRTGLTLRFPRFKKMRDDRDWKTALSWQGFLKLKKEVAEQTENKKFEIEVRRRGTKRLKKGLYVMGENDEPTFVPRPTEVAEIFKDMPFYVMTDSFSLPRKQNKTKRQIEELIKIQSGKIFQSEAAAPDMHIIGDKRTVKVAAIEKQGIHTIIKPQWVFDCIKQGCLLPFENNRHIFFAPLEEIHNLAEANVDEYGDAYARDVDVDELRKLLDIISIPPERQQEDSTQQELLSTTGETPMPGWMMRGFVVHVVPPTTESKIREVKARGTEAAVRIMGGEVSSRLEIGGDVSHVVVSEEGDAKKAREVVAEWSGRRPRVVGVEWVEACLANGTVVDEERFAV